MGLYYKEKFGGDAFDGRCKNDCGVPLECPVPFYQSSKGKNDLKLENVAL